MKTKTYPELWDDKDVDEMAHIVWKGCFGSDCDECEHRIEVDGYTCHVDLISELWRKWKNASEAEPVRHGHWISESTAFFCGTKRIERGDIVPIIDGSPICSCHCSVCSEWLVASDEYAAFGKYCPHCGAKMDEEK